MRRMRRSSRTRTRPTPSPPLRMGRANARRRRRERARRGGGSIYPRGRRDREAPRRREGARGREGRRPSCEVRSVFPPVARRESNPEARRRRSAGRRRAAIDAMRAMGRGRSRSVRRVVSRASRRALPRREERQMGLTSAAAIRKSRPRSARGALSLADAEPSIDESNIPMKILPGRSIRNLRKARQRAINNVARGKEERVERADTTHARARPTSSRVHVLTDVAVFSPRENLPLRLGVGRLLLSSPQPPPYPPRKRPRRPCGPRRSRCCARRPFSSARPAARCASRVSAPPRAFPATVPSRGALAMDTSHRGVFADVSATKPATFFPASFSPRPTAPLLLSPTLRHRRRRRVTSTPGVRRRPSRRFQSAYETYRRRRRSSPPG